jgi:hypothetical protein
LKDLDFSAIKFPAVTQGPSIKLIAEAENEVVIKNKKEFNSDLSTSIGMVEFKENKFSLSKQSKSSQLDKPDSQRIFR